MYDWTVIQMARLCRRGLLQDAAEGRATGEPAGDLRRHASLPSAVGWELARYLGRARKLLRRLPDHG